MKHPLLLLQQISYLQNGPYTLRLGEHEVAGIAGASGVGKTQLLRAVVETIQYNGELFFCGTSAQQMAPTEWRKTVALVPAEPVWWFETVESHFPGNGAESLLMLDRLGFDRDVLNWQIHRLSTGEKQRLALARAMAGRPAILLLDEPCSALDPRSVERVESLLLEYVQADGRGIVWVSHDLDQLRRVATTCYRLHREKLEKIWDTENNLKY